MKMSEEDITIFLNLTPYCLVKFGNLLPHRRTIGSHILVNHNPVPTVAKCQEVKKQPIIEQSVELKLFLGMYYVFLLISYTIPVMLESSFFTFYKLSSDLLPRSFWFDPNLIYWGTATVKQSQDKFQACFRFPGQHHITFAPFLFIRPSFTRTA